LWSAATWFSLPWEENAVPTTAWRFPGTEGADNAVARLKQLDSQDQINLMDIAVLRWPDYAVEPTTQEHVHEQGGKVASMMRRLQHPVIDSSMIESVKGDLRPGTSAVVLLSSGAEIHQERPVRSRAGSAPAGRRTGQAARTGRGVITYLDACGLITLVACRHA
jgi:hypothetical protein